MNQQLILFDYGQLDSETRIVVQQRTAEIRDLMRNTAENIVRVGEKLSEVRAKLANGRFEAWLENEFSWSRRTAYNFISVYERLGARANFAQMDLALSALYLLASPSTPEAAVEEALERAGDGEKITHTAAQEIVGRHREAEEATRPRQAEIMKDWTAYDAAAEAEAAGEEPPAWSNFAATPPLAPVSGAEGEQDDAGQDDEAEEVRLAPAPPPPARPTPQPVTARQPEPKPAPPAITLDFSTPVVTEEQPADVILTVRLGRQAVGQPPERVELDINVEGGLLLGRFPTYYRGEYKELLDLVRQACEEYFKNETATEEIIDE